jgi:hypothetical protein
LKDPRIGQMSLVRALLLVSVWRAIFRLPVLNVAAFGGR